MLDAFLQALPDLGSWTVDFGTVTDLVGLCVGAVILAFTVWLARRQLKIMDKQTEMMREQSEAVKRQEVIAVEQAAIAKRQGEIAETQHQIMKEQLAKRCDLHIRATKQTRNMGESTKILLEVVNTGSKAADGFYWAVLVPGRYKYKVTVLDERESEWNGRWIPLSEEEHCDRYDDQYAKKLFPKSAVGVCWLVIAEALSEFDILYRIASEDGVVPPKGFRKAQFKRQVDKFFSAEYMKEPYIPS